jgi:hypothetical protein
MYFIHRIHLQKLTRKILIFCVRGSILEQFFTTKRGKNDACASTWKFCSRELNGGLSERKCLPLQTDKMREQFQFGTGFSLGCTSILKVKLFRTSI